jgi:copper homeostasis protein CutC
MAELSSFQEPVSSLVVAIFPQAIEDYTSYELFNLFLPSGITDRNVNKIVSAMGATEVHVGAGGTKESMMEFRNPYCSMGYAISAPEYALKITSESKLGGMIQKF